MPLACLMMQWFVDFKTCSNYFLGGNRKPKSLSQIENGLLRLLRVSPAGDSCCEWPGIVPRSLNVAETCPLSIIESCGKFSHIAGESISRALSTFASDPWACMMLNLLPKGRLTSCRSGLPLCQLLFWPVCGWCLIPPCATARCQVRDQDQGERRIPNSFQMQRPLSYRTLLHRTTSLSHWSSLFSTRCSYEGGLVYVDPKILRTCIE